MTWKEKIRSSQTRTASTLFYTKRSRVSRIWAITDTDTGEEKRTGVVPTLNLHKIIFIQLAKNTINYYFLVVGESEFGCLLLFLALLLCKHTELYLIKVLCV